MKQIVPSS